VRSKLEDYEEVRVDNFDHSFADGMAFCALIHKHYPELIDFSTIQKVINPFAFISVINAVLLIRTIPCTI